MKKHLLTFIIVLSGWCVMAQTNTFPTTGNAGIGTTAPGANLVIQAATPELRFITSADSTSFARFLRSTASSNNLFQGKNHVLQVGSGSDAIRFTNTTQSFSSNDAGMPSGTSITMTFSCVYRGNSLYTFLKWGNSTQYITIFNVGATFYVYYGGTRIFFGIIPSDNSNWHNLVFVMNGSSGSLYVDNILNKTMSFEAAYNVVSGGAGSLSNNDGASFPIDIDQVLIYNRALSRTSGLGSSDEIAQINSSGAYTASPPTSGLIRRYEFEEGSGSTVADLNPNTTPYNLALNNSPTWLVNGGIVPVGGSASESIFFSVSDGLTNNERGIATWGDFNGRNQQQGKWFQWKQGSNYPLVSNNAGRWLFDPNRTVDTLAAVASTIDVAGNVTVGSAYAGINAAPVNGLIVQGNTGIGTPTPAYPLQINEPLVGQGTISVSASSGAVTGTGSNFVADFNVGDVIKANSETHTITAIASNTAMTTDNWTTTFSGVYTTNNAQRYTFSGKGSLYLGNVFAKSLVDGPLNIRNNVVDGPKGISGLADISVNQYTVSPNTSTNFGIALSNSVGGSNTQNWTATNSLVGLQSLVATQGGATGTITGIVGIRSQIGVVSATASITNAYMYQGAVQPINVSPVISNLTGMLLYNLNVGTNNTGVFLDIGTAGVVSPLPNGNWGIYDNTGYNNYFAGNIVVGTNTMPAGYKFAVAGNAIAESMTVKLHANWPDYVI